MKVLQLRAATDRKHDFDEIHALDHSELSRNYESVPFKTAEEWAIERFGTEGTKLLRAHPDIAAKLASEHIKRIVRGL